MGIVSRSLNRQDLYGPQHGIVITWVRRIAAWARKYRLTVLFAITAIALTAAAALLVNLVVGNLAENNLIRIAEENTARDGSHIQSMMRGGHSMDSDAPSGMTHSETMESMVPPVPASVASEGAMDSGMTMQNMQQPKPLTLETLSGPDGLPSTYSSLVAGMNIVEFNLFDLQGTVVWSNDSRPIGRMIEETPQTRQAAAGEVSSIFVEDYAFVDASGLSHRTDVVQTTLPLRDTLSGQVIGVMQIYRNVAQDVAFQVDDAKSVVLWTTVGAMGGLFLFLFGFILLADSTIHRSRRRELAVVEDANNNLEARVQERTRELRDAQDQLVRSEKLAAIGQLAGGVAHDLRNPLGAINNAIYYLKKKLGPSDIAQSNPRISQFLQIAEEEVEHSNQIISDLMTFTRVDVSSLSATNLAEAVDNALSTMEIHDNVRIVKQLDPHLPEVMADGEQLYRVFINLANNAQDAMADGGELTINTRRVDGYAEVGFQDTGSGISEDVMKKIFEPLFTTKTKGTGLGLAVCQQIVMKHSGSIQASSTPGEGSTFTVKLPLNTDGS